MFAVTNVVTRLPARDLVLGYARVLETLYEPETYFARCREHLRSWASPRDPGLAGSVLPAGSLADLGVVLRSVWRQGARGSYRGAYFRFLGWTLRHHPRKLGLAFAQTCAGHHFVTYTRETVVPRLRAQREEPVDRGEWPAPGLVA